MGVRKSAAPKELGAEGADADDGAHLVQEAVGLVGQERPDLGEGGVDREGQDAAARRGQEVPAHQERHHLAQGEGGGELGAEAVHEAVADAPAVLVVVEGEAGLLEDGEVAPDGAHGAAELARRLVRGEAI